MSQEQLEFKIGEDEEPATVELTEGENGVEAKIADETPPPAVETEQPAAPQQEAKPEEELAEYSDKVKKRIDKMTAKLREAQRREQAALEYAKQIQAHAQQLQHRFQETDSQRLGEAKTRIETQAVALKQIIKKAREEGDIDTETEAQERLTQILFEQQRLRQDQESRPQVQQPQQPAYQQPVYQQPAQPVVDERAEQWAEENPWFGEDVVMTNAVKGIHLQLVTRENFNPRSEEYYEELDRRMKDLFPNRINGNKEPATQNIRANRPVQTVAPASRSSGVNNARRTVKLTPSQVAIAKKLGVPLEEYAKYVKE
jgi:hypothetical protein